LPVTRKSDLASLQGAAAAWRLKRDAGEKLAKPLRLPGPIYGEGRSADGGARRVACSPGGFPRRDRVANTVAYHSRRRARCWSRAPPRWDCTVVPTGVGQTEIQVRRPRLGIDGFLGTPRFSS